MPADVVALQHQAIQIQMLITGCAASFISTMEPKSETSCGIITEKDAEKMRSNGEVDEELISLLRADAPTKLASAAPTSAVSPEGSPDKAQPTNLVEEEASHKRVVELGVRLKQIWPKDKTEFLTSVSTALTVDSYYRAALPDGPPKLMIVSESPCFTREDVAAMKANVKLLKEAGIELNGLDNHVNLVLCLTYGEPWALDEEVCKRCPILECYVGALSGCCLRLTLL